MKRAIFTSIFIAIAISTTACVVKRAEFAIVGTKAFDLNMREFDRVGDNITGESTSHMIFIFPSPRPTVDEAIRDALQKVGGDIMTETTVYHSIWMIPPFYSQTTIEVKGTVWRLKGGS